MNLIKEHWTIADGEEFNNYLLTLSGGKDKGAWEKRIINTELDCIAVPSKTIAGMIKEIAKGNFIEFIGLWLWDNFCDTTITGNLICLIDDFDIMSEYLTKYAEKVDNWASCDTLKYKINKTNQQKFFDLSKQLIINEKPFARRIGMTILFDFVNCDSYIDELFEILNGFYNETEYYVNMVNAWLVAECFVKQKDKTLEFLKSHRLNKFTINKAISKCRDSFRVSKEDKEFLLSYKEK